MEITLFNATPTIFAPTLRMRIAFALLVAGDGRVFHHQQHAAYLRGEDAASASANIGAESRL